MFLLCFIVSEIMLSNFCKTNKLHRLDGLLYRHVSELLRTTHGWVSPLCELGFVVERDPPVVDNASQTKEKLDWDDVPDVNLGFVPRYMSPVSAPSPRVIAFGTIHDRDGAINDAMHLFSPTHPDKCRLSKVYLEGELLRHRDNLDAPYTDTVRHTLEELCTFLGASPSETVLREAVRTILSSREDAFLDQGYALVGLPKPDAKSFSLPPLPYGLALDDQPAPLSDLWGQNPLMFSDLLERCRLACGSVEMTQVLVVTSSCYRVIELASMAGFTTVLVHRPGGLGSGVDLETCDPILPVDGLQVLTMKLQKTSSAICPSSLKKAVTSQWQIRVWGMYQTAWDAPDTPSALPYKALITYLDSRSTRIEFAHSRGDVKPENFALGDRQKSHIVYLFDFGVAKLYVDPSTGARIPFREGRIGLGAARYMSYNAHFGREQGRRDGLEALGNVLLYLIHGRLPCVEAKLLRISEMKASSAFRDLLARPPTESTTYFDHRRSPKFDEKPNYELLRQLSSQIIDREGSTGDTRFDRVDESFSSRKGTPVPGEYKSDVRFTHGDSTTVQGMRPRFLQSRRSTRSLAHSGISYVDYLGTSMMYRTIAVQVERLL
ncbi:hypothetical protein DFH29DRAFT_1065946 [Suillus ampliporus]|nr:hypothetical protein DFH29DRAFT_1065946 [Suillus ampliporus]